MSHPEMVRRFGQLLPQFEHTTDPEGVLTKYARENNFAPAQLEKLGHIFNTAKTLHFLDKAANRAGTFKIVDVPQLLEGYQAFDPGTPAVKKASAPVAENNPWAVPHVMDRVWGREKAAFVAGGSVKSTDVALSVNEIFKQACAVINDHRNADEARELLVEIKEEIYDGVRKLAALLDHAGLNTYPATKAQVLKAYPEKGARVCSLLEKHMADVRHLPLTEKCASISVKSFAKDPGGWFPIVEHTAKLIDLHSDAFKAATFFKEAIPTKEKTAPPSGKTKKPHRDGDGDGIAPETSTKKPKKDAPIVPEDIDPFYTSPKTVKAEEGKPEGGKPSGPGAGAAFQGILNSIGGTAAKVPGQIASGAPAKWLAGVTHGGTDKPRKAMDIALGEDQNVAVLQRLMRDPIIGEADPQTVSEIYHVIREANPQVASNDMVAKLIVREALQYGSVPSHTYKELVDLNKTQQDVESKTLSNDKARYSIGGVGGGSKGEKKEEA